MDRQNFIEFSDITFIINKKLRSHLSPLCPHLSTITGLRAIREYVLRATVNADYRVQELYNWIQIWTNPNIGLKI